MTRRYCNDVRCLSSGEAHCDGIDCLCLRSDAPALSYVALEPGTAVQTSSLAPVPSHHDEATGLPAHIVYYGAASNRRLTTLLDGDVVPITAAIEKNDSELMYGYDLLVFDRPLGDTEENRGYYMWTPADKIADSGVLVLSFDARRRVWCYGSNSCAQW